MSSGANLSRVAGCPPIIDLTGEKCSKIQNVLGFRIGTGAPLTTGRRDSRMWPRDPHPPMTVLCARSPCGFTWSGSALRTVAPFRRHLLRARPRDPAPSRTPARNGAAGGGGPTTACRPMAWLTVGLTAATTLLRPFRCFLVRPDRPVTPPLATPFSPGISQELRQRRDFNPRLRVRTCCSRCLMYKPRAASRKWIRTTAQGISRPASPAAISPKASRANCDTCSGREKPRSLTDARGESIAIAASVRNITNDE